MIPLSYNVRSLYIRKATTAATALGIGLVVFVLAGALMLAAGIRKAFLVAGHPDHAIVLRAGADTEISSSIDGAAIGAVIGAPGIARAENGVPLAAPELVAVIVLDRRGAEGQVSNVQVRGVREETLRLRPEVHVIKGRAPKPGTDEAMIGKRLAGRFRGVDFDQSFELKKNRPLKVVGVFEAGGSSFESEIWADLDMVRSSFGRGDSVSSISVRLESPLRFDAMKAAVESDKRLGLEVAHEIDYYARQSSGMSGFVTGIGVLVAFFFAIAAIIGAVITMSTAIANRRREIGTLRALGFSRGSILFSFLLEALVLALLGGLIGVAGAIAMSLVEVPMMNLVTWQEVTFRFEPSAAILLVALFVGCGMGIMGGLIPAIRAARVRPVEAIRG